MLAIVQDIQVPSQVAIGLTRGATTRQMTETVATAAAANAAFAGLGWASHCPGQRADRTAKSSIPIRTEIAAALGGKSIAKAKPRPLALPPRTNKTVEIAASEAS